MAAGHGGSRPGAGRPKGPKTDTQPPSPPTRYDDALAYLEAVVRGEEPPDGLRIAAARIVLPFQKPKTRAPVESPAPKRMREQQERAIDQARTQDWNQRANAVRNRLGKKDDSSH